MLWITVRSGWIYWRKWGGAFRSSFGYGFTPQNIKKIEVAKSMPRKKILVTGANGFVGQHLCARLRHEGCVVRGAVRQISHQGLARDVEQFPIGSVDQHTDWSIALADVDAVIHLAARVHVMCDSAKDPLTEFRKVNVIATSNLARQAASAGVKRFIFISSIKVNGEGTPIDKPFTAEDVPAPVDPYGISKHEAEEALKKIADETGLELVIIRPVLVYGPKVKGNFKELMRWLFKEIPLPVGTINNKRSLVSLGNLADFIVTCLAHPRASNQVFLVSDGIDLSTPELLTMTALAMNKKTHLVAVPANLLCSLGELLGKKMVVQRLCESLRVDIGKNRELLGWIPPVSVEAALEETVSYYMADYDR
jgi:nucleoside-diphosphate-sugar epimerase